VTDLVLQLRFAGSLVVALGLAHVVLPMALGWRWDLASLTLINRQVAYVHLAFIGVICVLLGLLSLTQPEALLGDRPLGHAVLAGLVVFWGLRLAIQLVVFDRRSWPGASAGAVVHLAALATWTYLTGVYLAALIVSG
jgi:hypothetical protein